MTPPRATGLLPLCLMLFLLAGCSTNPEPKVVTVVETRTVVLRPPVIDPCPQTVRPMRSNGDLLADRNLAARERDECASRVQTVIDWQARHPAEGLGEAPETVDSRSRPPPGVGSATR